MNIVNNDSAIGRGLRTAIQTIVGLLVSLAITVWLVPGVPEAVAGWALQNLVPVALAVGVPAGLTSYTWNYLRPDVPNS